MKLILGIIGKAIGGAFGALVDWIMRSKQRADQIELGQKRQANAQHQAAAEATKRLQEAEAAPHDAATTQGRLKDGTF